MTYIEFEPGQKFAKPGAETADTMDHFKDCGYLIQDNELVIDIDTLPIETIQKMIQWFGINTQIVWTDRGAHFYFRKPDAATVRSSRSQATRICCLGFPIEIKDRKNSPNGITVKRNGIARTVDNPGVRQDCPEIFYKYKRFKNLLGLDEGDGRNQALHTHKIQLENMQGWKNILTFINDFVFAKPLEPKEFDAVARDEKIDAKKGSPDELAAEITNEYKCALYGETLWFFYKGEYIENEAILNRIIYQKLDNPSSRFIDEVKKLIRCRAELIPKNKIFDIKLGNGILRKGKWIPIESEEFTPYSINIDYNPNAAPMPAVDDYIDKLTDYDPDYRLLLMEVLAHTLITDAEFKRQLAKFFIFRGDGSNGKGTLLMVIKGILGEDNCSALSIKGMEDRTSLYSMKGKLANLGDDIEAAAIDDKDMKLLKNISTCDRINIRGIYQASEEIQLTCSLIFTSNSNVKTWEKGEAYQRRVLWLPMFTKIKESEKKPDFISSITTPECLEYWMKLIIDGYFRIYANKRLTYSAKVDEFNKEYHLENNIIEMYIQDAGTSELMGKTISEVKRLINEWDGDDGKILTSRLIKDTLEHHNLEFKVKKVNGSTARVLCEKTQELPF